ncbi:polymorphic toxin type 50 domain-containing protein [Clostridium scatologenes]|uniref:Transposase n=1 Tax=Clostridium scatologenes TaxID=1548 RepID=A0A0E3JPV4_CLOSL|nr:polymorphic toxin type 50 domain-containing protein [Clostridium scatologenes]AKA70517.1 Transposase [Clostridium scatologenes]
MICIHDKKTTKVNFDNNDFGIEENICSVFSKISGMTEGISQIRGMFIISESGQVDKNKVMQLMLKNPEYLTKEEKEILEYAKIVLGEDGQVISTKTYGYKLAYTNEPKISTGIVFVSPIEGAGNPKIVNGFEAKVNVGQQQKHIPGTNNYKNEIANGKIKSPMNGNVDYIQGLLNKKAGTGEMIGTNKERVDFGDVIGQYVDPTTGTATDTTIGIIHYGKNGAHIVPARPK